jgi:Mg2+ and Co2+ transporter CorA
METIHNFIKGLQIIEKYMYEDVYPFEIDEYTLHFRVDPWKIQEMSDEDKKTLEELHFIVKNNGIYTIRYTW